MLTSASEKAELSAEPVLSLARPNASSKLRRLLQRGLAARRFFQPDPHVAPAMDIRSDEPLEIT
jgi:hypothetical protein